MKFLFVILATAVSMSAIAATKATVELTSQDNRVTFEAYEYSRVLHIAANPTCIEMTPTHVLPIPTSKSKTSKVEVTSSKITFDKKLGGYCNYKFANVGLKLRIDNNKTVGLTIYADDAAPAEIDLICSEGKYGPECREKGDARSNGALGIPVDLNKATVINVSFE